MLLEVGTRLGPYEITARIGAGGMGEVWKARDTRLNRTVAIKVSKEAFSERFHREAHAIAALNHPNICQIYDVGPDYLVLEYVEGTPVDPPDGVRKLLDLAVQIADGMAAAHAAGFVHRDLKPSNVLVTREGRAKILDFGLAKSLAPQAQAGATQALTVTGSGFVSGTAAYMSPEQVHGSMDLDARSDQFSFGLLLYEMATGRRAFERPSNVETLAAIAGDEPSALPATLPAPLRWIIERCLAKEPEERYESSRDLFLELRSLREHLADASSTYSPVPARSRARFRLAAAFAAGVVLTVIAAFAFIGRGPAPSPELRFRPFSFEQGGQHTPVWSPDGRAVAFAARQRTSEPYQVYVRNLDSPVATKLTQLPEPAIPHHWTTTGRILFEDEQPPRALWSVSAVGGTAEKVIEPLVGSPNWQVTAISRDGSVIALLRRDDGMWGVWLGSLVDGSFHEYEPAPFAAPRLVNVPMLRFSPDASQLLLMWNPVGNAVPGEQAWLLPYPADAARPPRRVLEDLPAAVGTPHFAWLPNNRHIVVSTSPDDITPRRLYVADTVSGAYRPLSSGTTLQVLPAVSPDGDKVVFVEAPIEFDIVSVDIDTAQVSPLIATKRTEQMPAWAPSAPAMVYVTDRNGGQEIWLHEPGRADRPLVTARHFPTDDHRFIAPALSHDGTRLIYVRTERRTPTAYLWMSAVAGSTPVRLTDSDGRELSGSWSPDGAWFAYTQIEGDAEVALKKVRTVGQATPETIVTNLRGSPSPPVWSPDGDWILVSNGGLKLISPDGATTRDLGIEDSTCAFARGTDRLYCIRAVQPDDSLPLVVIDYEGRVEKRVGSLAQEHSPYADPGPGLRLTFTPDGQSLVYSVMNYSPNLWLIEGLSTLALP